MFDTDNESALAQQRQIANDLLAQRNADAQVYLDYEQRTRNPTTLYEQAVQTGVAPKSLRDFVDINLTYQQKVEELKKHELEKEATIEGFEDGELLDMADADSGKIRIAGETLGFRLVSGSQLPYDAVDSKKVLDSNSNKSQVSVAKQYSFLSRMLGKSPSELTDDDFQNYKNYESQQRLISIKGGEQQPFDPTQHYEQLAPNALAGSRVKYKVMGKDTHGRLLLDIVNPETGRSLGFDSARNPYTNTRFNLLDSISTPRTRRKLEQFNAQQEGYAAVALKHADKYDTDGRLSEDLDLIKSSAYQSAARLLQHIPGTDQEYWSQVANSLTGQQLADLATGVKKSTRTDFAKEAQHIADLVEKGEYDEAAITAFGQIDRFFAESAPQMALLVAGSAVTAPLAGSMAAAMGGGAIATTTAKLVQTFAGASLAGLDKTLADIEDFKRNNGRDMTPEEFAQTFLVTTATLVPEEFLIGMFGGTAKGLFAQAFGKSSTKAVTSTSSLLAKGAKQFTVGTVGEGLQERLETATDNALTKKRDKNYEGFFKESWKEWNSGEAKTAQLIGHMMGATLSGAGSGLNTSVGIKLNNRDAKHLEALQSNMRTNTVSEFNASSSSVKEGTANVEASDKLIEEVRNSKVTSKSSSDEIVQEIQSLQQKINTTTDLNVQATDIARSRINDLAIETVSRMKEKADRDAFLKAIGQTTEQLFQEKVYGSSYNAELAFSNNVRLSAEEREDVRKELLQTAKDLGLSEKQAKKTLDMVNEDVRSGVKGYYSYGNTLNALIDEGKNNLNLNAADKDDLHRKQTQTAIDLVRILTNQFEKVSRFAQGANSIANERARRNQRILYPNGKKSFELKADNFIQDSYASGRGAHGVFRSAVEDVQNIQSILNNALKADPNFKKILDEVMSRTNYSLDMINEVGKFVKQYTDAIDTIQHKSFSRYQEKNNTSESKEELPPANLVNKLRRLLDSKAILTKGNRNEYTNAIRNASEEAITKAKELIQNGKFSEAQKEEYLDRLDEIRTGTKQTAENIKQRKEDNSKLVSQINDITSKNNVDDISKLPNTEDTLDKITKVLNDAAKLFMEFNTLSKEETEIKDNLKSFIDSLHKIRQEKILEYNKEQSKASFVNVWYGSGENAELSNLAERLFVYEGKQYRSVEHAYQTLKSGTFDANTYAKYQKAKEGSKITGKPANTKDNANIKLMKALMLASFQQNEQAKQALLATGNKTLTHTQDKGMWGKVFPELLTEVRNELKASEIDSKSISEESEVNVQESSENLSETKSEPSKALGTKDSPIQIYSDGSDIKGTGKLGYGAVFVINGKEYAISGTNEDSIAKELVSKFPNAKFSNPTMEMLALAQVLKTIANLGVGEHIQINQDYKGASNYSGLWEHAVDNKGKDKKAWKAKEPYIKFLVDEAVAAIKQIEANGGSVSIQWVKGHQKSGTEQAKMNDLADKYAKSREHINTFAEAYQTQDSSKIDSKPSSEEIGVNTQESSENALETKFDGKIPVFDMRPAPTGAPIASTPPKTNTPTFWLVNGKIVANRKTVLNFNIVKDETGKPKDKFAELKHLMLRNMQAQGYTKALLNDLIKTDLDAAIFTLFHEKSHKRHNDNVNYNKLSIEKQAELEARATIEAVEEFKKYKENPQLDIEQQIKDVLHESVQLLEDVKVTEDSPVSHVLNPNSNSSVTLEQAFVSPNGNNRVGKTVQDRYVNLSNELTTRSYPSSHIATDANLYSNLGLLRPMLVVANRIKNRLQSNISGKSWGYFFGTASKKGSVLESSPHLRLLYNITTDVDSNKNQLINLTFNETTLAAVDFSVREYIATMNLADKFKGLKNKDIAKLFGGSEETFTSEDINKLRQVIKSHGVPMTTIADSLGSLILRNLGIKANNETGTRGYYQRVASGLGMFALEYLAEQGAIEFTQFNSETWVNNQIKAVSKSVNDSKADINVSHPLFHGRNKGEQNLVNCIKIKDKNLLTHLKDTYLGQTEKDEHGKIKHDEHGKPIRKESSALKNYKITQENDAQPRYSKRKISKVEYLRNTEDLVQVAEVVHEVMQELTNTAYEIDSPLASWLCDDTELVGDTGKTRKQLLKERLGWADTAEHIAYSKEDADSAEGINRSVENQIDSLIDAMREQEKRKRDLDERAFDGIYFNWFVSSNGRLFMDSTTLNPQTNKFQRFLCLPQAVKQTFDNNNEEHIKAEAFAIAQAFDSVGTDEDIKALGERLNGFTIKQLLTLRDDLLALNTKEFKNKYNKPAEGQPKTELHIGLEGIENLGQCFNIVQHLLRKKRANGQPFETWLSIENDSTTSGYAIRFLNMPLPSMVNGNSISSYGAKTGVFSAEEGSAPIQSMHELKQFKDGDRKFLDIYKTIAADTSKYLDTYNESVFDSMTEGDDYKKALKGTFLTMLAALPKADEKGNVTSALRSLLKPAVMTFGYTAGEKSIARKLTSEIILGDNGFIPTYMKFKQSGMTVEEYAPKNDITVNNLKAIVATLDDIEKTRIKPQGTLAQQLKNMSASEIYVKHGNKVQSIESYFNAVLAPTYGQAVWNALSTAFNDYIDINNSMNELFVASYRLFEDRLNTKLSELETEYTNGIPIKVYNEVIESLRPLMPTLQLAYGDNATDGQMLLMRSEKEYSAQNKVQHPIVQADGTLRQMTTSTAIRTFGNPKKAGAVIPIHFIDGMTMLLTMLDTLRDTGSIGINPVHDATVMSALQGQQITQKYNENLLVVNAEFNVYERLLNRFKQIANEYEKQSGIDTKSLTVKDAYSTEAGIKLSDAIKKAEANLKTINNARDQFYAPNRTITICNMDGQQGTAVTLSTNPNSSLYVDTKIGPRIEQIIQQENQAYAKQAKKQGSTYKGYQTTNQIYQLLQDAKTDKEARIGLLQTLQNMSWAEQSSRVASDEHMQRLEAVLRRIDPKYLQDLKVQLTEGMFNAGEFNPSDNTITIAKDTGTSTSLDPVSKLAIFSTMSLAEIYAHEVTHAGLDFAFKQHLTDRLAYAKEIDLLMQVYIKAQEIFTWEDFMPKDGTYDPSLKSLYEKHAKNTYDYIFKNPDKANLTGLKEFCAYGLTNENMVNKLSQHHLKNDTKNKNLFQKLLSAAKELLSLVFGKRSVIKGKNNTLLQDLDALTTKLSQVDNEAANTLMKHPQRALEAVSSLLGWIKDTGNAVLAPMFEWVGTAADRSGLILTSHWVSQVNGNFFDDAKLVASSALLCLFSAKRRQVLKEWMRDCIGLAQQGTIMSIMKDMTTPDMQSYRLEMLSMMTRLIDQNSKALEATVYNELAEKFGKEPLTKLEEQSLTEICLQTDLQCLLDGSMTIDDIISLVKDENALKAKIDTLEQSLKTNKNHRWFINQARALAHYMTTGIGNEVLSLNAQGIAEGRFSGRQFDTPTSELVNQIDQLTTLYALANSNQDLKQVLGTLKPEGIEYFLQTHKQFVTESREGLEVTHVDGTKTWENPVNSAHIVKGYYKQLLDTSYDVKIDFADSTMQNLMAKEGYKLEYVLPKNNTTGQTLAVYRRTWATPQRRDGAAFLLMGAHTMGTTLKETGYNTAEREAKYRGMGKHLWEIYKKKAEGRAKDLANRMLNRDMTIEDIKKISDGYTPVYSPKDGTPADYRITMTHENKQKIFNPDTRGLTVLSKMFATQNSKVQTKARNLALISFLEHDMNEHMNPKHHIDKEGRGYKYIKIEQNSNNEFLKKAWTAIPQELKDAAKKAKDGFYVREDWLAELFGTPSISLSDANALKTNTPAGFRRGISITEYLLKVIAREVKRKIVNLPTVVIGNIVSNFNYTAIMNGQSPAKVFKMQVENADNVRKYMADKKEINRIEFRRRIGTATEAEINRKRLLEMKVERNPVYPLIQKGFYQSIVEDMNPDDLETTGVIYKFFKESKLFNKVPKLVKQIGKQAFMAEGTPIYDFLFTVTQYSDFVARATEYQIQMNKKDIPPKFTKDGKVNDDWRAYEEQVTRSILNTFINYDRPQSSLEQYLNDLGLTMFTKFAKRIQPIVNGQLTKNPMGVLSMLFMQSTIWDTESIVEQNVFSKHWSALVHNPWGNFLDAITPMPYQMYSRW